MIPSEKVIATGLSILFGAFALWKRYLVEQTVPTVLQFGALGALIIVLMLIYKLASQWMDFKIHQKAPEPQRVNGDLSYNEQMARTIYDVNKTLSEVAVTNKLIGAQVTKQTDMMEKQTLVLDRLVNVLSHKHNLDLGGSN